MVRREGIGGAERDRTAGLLVANEALSQLSYSPTTSLVYQRPENPERRRSALYSFGAGWPNRKRCPLIMQLEQGSIISCYA